jgi:hypothetical protein
MLKLIITQLTHSSAVKELPREHQVRVGSRSVYHICQDPETISDFALKRSITRISVIRMGIVRVNTVYGRKIPGFRAKRYG